MAAQNIPLPAGWEAKYDPGQRRYFFIDHNTHKTSWEDPRLSMLQPHGPGYQMHGGSHQHHHSRSASPRHTPRHSPRPSPGHSTENIAMQELNKPKWQKDVENKFNIDVSTMGHHDDEEENHEDQKDPSETSFSNADPEKVQKLKRMFPTAEEWAIRKALSSNSNVEGMAIANLQQNGYKRQNLHTQMKESTLVNKLKKEFPTAEEGVIRDLVQCLDQNEARCIKELKDLGYKHNSLHQPTPRQPSPLTRDRESGSSPAKKVSSPTRKTSKVSSPDPPELSAEAKNKIKEKVAKELKDFSSSMITIALETTNYNEERAIKLLHRTRPKEKSTPRGSAERSLSPTSRGGASTSGRTSSTVTVTLPDFSLPSITVTSSRSGGKKSTTSITSTTSATRKPAARQASPKKPKAHSASPIRSRNVTIQKGAYMSPNRTTPVGPNVSLAAGPDKDLLISEYIKCSGPNPDYCNGPYSDNEQGPMDYYGPDESLSHGPNPDLRCGTNFDLLGGTIYGHKPVLVTTI